MNHSLFSRRRVTVATAALSASLAAGAIGAGGVDAKTQQLRYFQVSGQAQFYNVAGKAINLDPPTNGLPVKGDSFKETDLDFAGTPAHHAKRWDASDELDCTFESSDTATCEVAIAIGNSVLLGDDRDINLAGATTVLKLQEGTGAFRGEHGSVAGTDLPNNDATLVITLS